MQVVIKVVFTLYQVAFSPPRKSYQKELLFTHKNSSSGAISVTNRSCAEPISIVESHISDRCCATLRCSVNTYSAELHE